jgi:hypothetical protein
MACSSGDRHRPSCHGEVEESSVGVPPAGTRSVTRGGGLRGGLGARNDMGKARAGAGAEAAGGC